MSSSFTPLGSRVTARHRSRAVVHTRRDQKRNRQPPPGGWRVTVWAPGSLGLAGEDRGETHRALGAVVLADQTLGAMHLRCVRAGAAYAAALNGGFRLARVDPDDAPRVRRAVVSALEAVGAHASVRADAAGSDDVGRQLLERRLLGA